MDPETIPPPDVAAASDRHLLERIACQLDHLDTLLHEQRIIIGHLEPLIPLIPRALALLDPGTAMRKHFKPRRADAVPFRASAPLHVGEASEDRAPLGAGEA